ncbi:MAG: hypothetical protein NXH85_06640 [Pseudomonadaceae bacterium]|nr:hypothetical protein [Pseudomonadaceae bacterium]
MIKELGKNLGFIAYKLGAEIAPATNTSYDASSAGSFALLLAALAQEADRAVETRMSDIEAIRALLPDDSALPLRPASWHLDDVNALHADALEQLIDVHRWAEENDAALDRAIWQFLNEHASRHALELG